MPEPIRSARPNREMRLEQSRPPRPRNRVPRYLSLESCLALALLGTVAGAGLRLAKPVDPPDPALLERLEQWKILAPALERAHHLQGPARSE